MENKHKMCIENKKITSEHSVTLIGTEIDNQLNFDNFVSTLCKKNRFPAKCYWQNTLVFQEKRL